MSPEEARDRIRLAILGRQDLRWTAKSEVPEGQWLPEGWNEYTGFCHIATQVFCHFVDRAVPMASPDRLHFWAEIDGDVWDLTEDQFIEGFDHTVGKRTKFKGMSRRATELKHASLEVLL